MPPTDLPEERAWDEPGGPPPPPPPSQPRGSNRTLLTIFGLVFVVLVGSVIVALILRDDRGLADAGTSLPGEEFADPQGTYRLNVDPAWTPNHGAMAAEIELWMVGERSSDFAANVNVLTQAAPDVDLRGYSDLSIQQAGNIIENFTLVDDQIVVVRRVVAEVGSPAR